MSGKEEPPFKRNAADDNDADNDDDEKELKTTTAETTECATCHEQLQSIRALREHVRVAHATNRLPLMRGKKNGCEAEDNGGVTRTKTAAEDGSQSSCTTLSQEPTSDQVRTGTISATSKFIRCTESISNDENRLLEKNAQQLPHQRKQMDEEFWQKTRWLQFQVAQVWYVQFPRTWLQRMTESVNAWYFPREEGTESDQNDEQRAQPGDRDGDQSDVHLNDDHQRDQPSSHRNDQLQSDQQSSRKNNQLQQSGEQNDHQKVQLSNHKNDQLSNRQTDRQSVQQNDQSSKSKNRVSLESDQESDRNDLQSVSRQNDDQSVQQSNQPNMSHDNQPSKRKNIRIESDQPNGRKTDNHSLSDRQNDQQSVQQSDQPSKHNNDRLENDQPSVRETDNQPLIDQNDQQSDQQSVQQNYQPSKLKSVRIESDQLIIRIIEDQSLSSLQNDQQSVQQSDQPTQPNNHHLQSDQQHDRTNDVLSNRQNDQQSVQQSVQQSNQPSKLKNDRFGSDEPSVRKIADKPLTNQNDRQITQQSVQQSDQPSKHKNDRLENDQPRFRKIDNQPLSNHQNDQQSVQQGGQQSDQPSVRKTDIRRLSNQQNDQSVQQSDQSSKHQEKARINGPRRLSIRQNDQQRDQQTQFPNSFWKLLLLLPSGSGSGSVQHKDQPSKSDKDQLENDRDNDHRRLSNRRKDSLNVQHTDQPSKPDDNHLVSDQQSDFEDRRSSDSQDERQNEHQINQPSDQSSKRSTQTMWSKFVLLMWKNYLLQRRKPWQLALDLIIIPVVCAAVLMVIRTAAPETRKARQYPPFCPVDLPFMCDQSPTATFPQRLGQFDLVYSPTGNSAIDKSMGLFKLLFGNVNSYANEQDVEEHYRTSEPAKSSFAAIVFDDQLKDGAELPDDSEVKIRFPELKMVDKKSPTDWGTNQLFPAMEFAGPRDPGNDFGAIPEYHKEGFLGLETMLTYFLIYGQLGATKLDDIKTMTNDQKHLAPAVKMQRFPHASWIVDPADTWIFTFGPLVIMICFYYPVMRIVNGVTTEKERQLKEAMKIMGLSNWLHWTAWFVKSFVCFAIIVVIVVIMLKVPCNSDNYSVLTFATSPVVVVFLLLYACSCITFAFACSVFFSKASTAACMTQLIFSLAIMPFLLLKNKYATLNLATKMAAGLFMNTAMGFGFHVILLFERSHEGIQWRNVIRTATPEDNLTLGAAMSMLIVDTVLYLFIALYVEAVFPGQYGVPQRWNYLFTSAYWRGQPASKQGADDPTIPTERSWNFEREPDLEPGIEIKNLRKVFAKKPAVRNLSLNMYKDQITVLLGHNGAGKTTTMSMLTGMFPPTSGTATIEGHDIKTDMDGARLSLGLCPQHNILFDDLTVREHLIFFMKLKGLDKEEIEREVKTYIELLELVPKEKTKSSTLSGGMKRKLCVGIAFCGNSRVVMLDEPTAGMDPAARRAIWDLIEKQKGGRTILLTTHFMDEADLLGDRIAIMAGGELQCCGSSFFLKKRYGAGYRLIIDMSPECDPSQVTRTLQQYIPPIEIHSNVGSELTYLLVEDEADVFEAMLMDLEEHSGALGVRSYGISLTTLEEVFMKVGADHGQEESYNATEKQHQSKVKTPETKTGAEVTGASGSGSAEIKLTMDNQDQLLSGWMLVRNQFSAMCTKKYLSSRRNWIWLVGQFLIPIAFIIVALVQSRTSKETAGDLPKLSLSLKSYNDPIALIENTDGAETKEIHDIYADLVTSSGGKLENVDSISDVMMNYTDKVPLIAKRRYIVGATFKNLQPTGGGGGGAGSANPTVTVTAWFNNEPFHSPPLALGMALDSVYKYMLKKRIRFANHPLPFTAKTTMERLERGTGNVSFMLALMLAFGLSMVSPFYVLFYVRERVCKSKHLQFVSGVKIYVFWLCAFLSDFAIFLLLSLAIIITVVCFQEDGFKTAEDIGRFSLILLYYGVAVLPLIYTSSFWFDLPSTALTALISIFMVLGPMAFVLVTVFTPMYPSTVGYANWALLIEPHYSLATGIRETYATYNLHKMCKDIVRACTEQRPALGDDKCRDVACDAMQKCCGSGQGYFALEPTGIGRNLCYSFGLGATLFLLLLMRDYKCFSKGADGDGRHTRAPMPVADEDDDVAEEKRNIREATVEQLQGNYALALRNLTKYYKLRVPAVNGLYLGVKTHECFGLLGVNGAGKTTSFRMMTGDVKMSRGDVWINGYNIKTELGKVHESIGYCPQFDALLDELTAKETLVIFALLRGVPRHECAHLAERLAVDFDFERHLDKRVKNLSGGNKRKVSTAIAMIGHPTVVFLDEPTTGMDPATKRHLWDVLCSVRDDGKCIVLTSHSMEECEALCTRLVVMVDGNFKCLGSVQHLKNKFAAGYTLTIKVKKTSSSSQQKDDGDGGAGGDMKQVEKYVASNFPTAKLREKHQEMLTYNIVDTSIPWSKMFGILQKAKGQLNIEDYSLGQSSLEQVFLSFTNPKPPK